MAAPLDFPRPPRRADSLSLHYYTTLPSPAQEKLTAFSDFLVRVPISSFYYIPVPPLPYPTAGSGGGAPPWLPF